MYKFLYLDDDPSRLVEPIISRISGSEKTIEIIHMTPGPFEKTVVDIEASLVNSHGLILDWKLNGQPVNNGIPVTYKAAELAQYFRREAAEGKPSFPIFVWSTEQRLKESYYNDNSSHDLFDKIYLKESTAHPQFDISQNPDLTRMELISFAKAYEIAKSIAGQLTAPALLVKLMGLEDKNEFDLDERIVYYFDTHPEPIPIHEFIQFIFRELVEEPGPLVDETLLAVRLGIDTKNSSQWPELLELISQTTIYKGIFSDQFPRWWMNGIYKWWNGLSSESLMFINANKRIEVIREKTGINEITAAVPLENYSSSFWTICEGLKVPIDPEDGFIIKQPEPFAWQDRRYISKQAALDRIGYGNGLMVHPLIKDELEFLIDEADATNI